MQRFVEGTQSHGTTLGQTALAPITAKVQVIRGSSIGDHVVDSDSHRLYMRREAIMSGGSFPLGYFSFR